MKSALTNILTLAVLALLGFFLAVQPALATPDIGNPDAYWTLTNDFTFTVPTGGSVTVYGTSDPNNIILESGSGAKFSNFLGNNTITIKANSSLFDVSRSGATVTIEGTDGTILSIPATTTIQTITFNDLTYELVIDGGVVYLGEQVVTGTPASLESVQSLCDSDLSYCTTSTECSDAGGYWWNNTCNSDVANHAPVANAGADQNVNTGDLITLDGSASSDADGDTLTYNWSITSKPEGSNVTLSNVTETSPTFILDVDGEYVLQLLVNDGMVDSTADSVTITTMNTFYVSTTEELRDALHRAATNGLDDKIILADGTYKTTNDGEGTFIYYEQNGNSLTIEGTEKTILDGDSTQQIIKASSGVLTINNIFFINGNSSSDGGAVSQTSSKLYINNCTFQDNYAAKAGGAIYATSGFETSSSLFKNNQADGSTGSWENGGAIFFDGYGIVQSSQFINNISSGSSSRPGGMSIYADFDSYLKIENSYFESNNTEEYSTNVSILRGYVEVHNTIFNKSKSNIGLFGSSTAKVYNTIFKDTSGYNFIADDEGKVNIYYSYINISLQYGGFILFEENNIFEGINLSFVDEANSDYHLTATSDLIDAGTTDIEGIGFPETDMDGNSRIVGGAIDIGAYEYQ